MSDFLDRLQRERREGTALPQREQLGEVGQPAPEVAFRPPSAGVPMVCTVCGALVDIEATPLHAGWHATTRP